MISEGELMFQMGAIMLLAFIGAAAAKKFNQSVMIGYIVVGIFLGPFMSFDFLGFRYEGIIQDTSLISAMSKIGLVLLLFFVGLEFSFSRLMKTRIPALILGFINLSMNIFFGFVVGQLFGWSLVDSFFLAGVMAMNSTAIAVKSLIDMKRMSNPETELILAFEVVGTFVAMLILTVGSGLVATGDRQPGSILQMAAGIIAFCGFFIMISVWLVPRVLPRFEKIESDELFILFALGTLFLSAALAQVCFVPTIIGAFFLGMTFAESKLATRLEKKLVSVKDAFVAIFFISFGMMINPTFFPVVIPMLIVAVPLILLSDVFVASIVTYLMGYSPRAAMSVGTTISGYAEESVLYASVGSSVKIATRGSELMPFAGAFCFITSALTPLMMRNSGRLAGFFSRIMPRRIAFSASLISRTLSKTVLPSSFPLFKVAKKTGLALAVFFVVIIAILLLNDYYFWIAVAIGCVIVWLFARYARREIDSIVQRVNYVNLGLAESSMRSPITNLASRMVAGVTVSILLIAVVWRFYWYGSLLVLLGYFIVCLLLLRSAAIKLEMSPLSIAGPAPPESSTSLTISSLRTLDHITLLNRADERDFKSKSRMLRRSLKRDDLRL